jgi:hypothetical protein
VSAVKETSEANDEEKRCEADDRAANAKAREQGGGEDAGEDCAETPKHVERGESGAGMGGTEAAADEDVGGGDELSEAETSEEESNRGGGEAVREGKGSEAAAAESTAGNDGEAKAGKDSDAAKKGAEEFCADEDSALGVSELPLVEEDGKDGAEQNCAEAGEDESCSEPESGGAGAAVVEGGFGGHEERGTQRDATTEMRCEIRDVRFEWRGIKGL